MLHCLKFTALRPQKFSAGCAPSFNRLAFNSSNLSTGSHAIWTEQYHSRQVLLSFYLLPCLFQDSKVGDVVFDKLANLDPDSNVNGQVEYFIGEDPSDLFEIDLPHQGLIKLKRKLDFETAKTHYITIIARVSFNDFC